MILFTFRGNYDIARWQWQENLPKLPFKPTLDIFQGQTSSDFGVISAADFSLDDIVKNLSAPDNMTFSAISPGNNPGSGPISPHPLPSNYQRPGSVPSQGTAPSHAKLNGTIKVTLRRYLHVHTNLLLSISMNTPAINQAATPPTRPEI